MAVKCENCFHVCVCKFKETRDQYTTCGFYSDKDTTVTLPVFDAGSQAAIKRMQANGYSFVNSEFLSQLVKDSGELASYKAKAFVANRKKGR